MNELTRALLYSIAVVVSAVLGGWFPLRYRADPRRLDFLLAASAGILVGIIGLHLLPESLEDGGTQAIWWMIGGYLFLHVIERYMLPRSFHHLPHALPAETSPQATGAPGSPESPGASGTTGASGSTGASGAPVSSPPTPDFGAKTGSEADSERDSNAASEVSPEIASETNLKTEPPADPATELETDLETDLKTASPLGAHAPGKQPARAPRNTAGLGAYLGLALHTITDGIALGAAMEDPRLAPYVLLAIILHKIPSAFALSSVLVKARVPATLVMLASGSLGFMVALGAIGFRLASHVGDFDALAFTPYAVAFSAGSFIHVTLADLLPDLQHSHTRRRHLLVALLLGLGLSVVLSSITPHH